MKNVLPATYIAFSRRQTRTTCYWTFTPGTEEPKPEAVGEFRELLADAVRLRTRSDVPLGACLSGGLDSSTLVSLVDLPGQVLHCFSTHYDEPAYDESRYAALVAKRRGLEVHWVRPHPRDMIETMRKIVWHHDAPTPVRGRFAEWFVMREAARHVKVVLTGHGSDELLAGYVRDIFPYLIDRARGERMVGADLIREAVQLARVGGSLHWFALTAMWGYLRDPRRRGARPYASNLNNMLWHGFRSHGLPESLHGDDAISTAFSLESRAPFLDHRIVELCFSLPFHDKVADGWTKSLLRRSMTDVLPEEILARRHKLGFQAPVGSWLRLDDNWRAVRELLLDRRSRQRGGPRRSTTRARARRIPPRALPIRPDAYEPGLALDHGGALVPGVPRWRWAHREDRGTTGWTLPAGPRGRSVRNWTRTSASSGSCARSRSRSLEALVLRSHPGLGMARSRNCRGACWTIW